MFLKAKGIENYRLLIDENRTVLFRVLIFVDSLTKVPHLSHRTVLSPLNKGIFRFSSLPSTLPSTLPSPLPSSLPSSPPHPSQKDKNLKYPHLSMCRTFSPYKIRGEYFSLCASTQIKISASHLCLFRDITY